MMMGKDQSGEAVDIDLPRLLETRMLVQANSGGGKSWALRRLLEQTAKAVQQIVIDPEGEFATLREKFDYIIAAPHDADVVANPKTAALLARRLLETGVSAVVDIYDLKAGERQIFVRRFLDALVNAPRKLWHPTLLVLDEAHVFCPQVGGAEAAPAVIDVCTRGRKRGLCPVLATQRLSKLHKDAAAEMLNKLVGRTSLDVDVKRAADELGIATGTATPLLRGLEPGTFFAYGPALTPEVLRVNVGPVVTTHPQSGQRLMAPPPQPNDRIRASLAKLADLQQQADKEVQDMDVLKARVVELERALRQHGAPESEVQRRIKEAVDAYALKHPAANRNNSRNIPTSESEKACAAARPLIAHLTKIFDADRTDAGGPPATLSAVLAHVGGTSRGDITKWQPHPKAVNSSLRAGAVRILQQLAARAPAGYSRAQVGALTAFSPKGGTFNTYLGDLRRSGFIEERDKLVYATEAGIRHLGADVPATPTSHEEAMSLWRGALRAGAFRMLEAIVAAGTQGLARADIAAAVDMEIRGGTFNTYLGDLRRNGLITESGGVSVANDILFPAEVGRGR